LDDIIIFAKSFDEHLSRLSEIFERIRLAKLKLKPSKCSLLQKKVSFLGHIISKDGIEVQPDKVETVKTWPRHKTIHDVRSFLGLCGYYRRFIERFSDIAAPLYGLTQKGVRFHWTMEHEQAFGTLKEKLTEAPILGTPEPEGEYILDTDASLTGVGAVLSQVQNGQERVLGYASRTLQPPEQKYCTTRRELLAVVYGLKQYRQYVLGRPFTIRTDHSALTWLKRTPEPMPQLARWLTYIEQYDYRVIHRPGTKHGNADALSRRPDEPCGQCKLSTDEFEPCDSETELKRPLCVRTISVEDRVDPLVRENLAKEQQEDPEIGPIVKLRLSSEDQPPIEQMLAESEITKIYWSQWNQLVVKDGLVHRVWTGKHGKPDQLQLLAPKKHRTEGMKQCHTGMTGGHMGTRKTLDQVQRRFYWLTWKGDTARYCRQCVECCTYHRGKIPRTAPLQPIIPGAPWERLCIDTTGPHPKSDRGHVYILTCTDPFTKWTEAFPLRNKEAETIAKVLVEQVITRFGTPIAVLSDN